MSITSISQTELHTRISQIRLIVFDFDGVFTDNMVYVAEDGTESVRCSRADGIGLRKLDKLGIANMVLSTETNPVVSKRCEKLKIRCLQGSLDKLADLQRVVAAYGFQLSEVAFVGNDINDLEVLRVVGLPIVVQDAHADVLPYGLYRTHKAGGTGAVREICDLFEAVLNIKGQV